MKTQVAATIRKYGEPVEIYPRVGQSSFCTAAVQRPISDTLINDVDDTSFIIYAAVDDVGQPPLKFDRIRVRGDMRTIDTVHTENAKGEDIVYVMRVQG
jgi:hypothetical protein